MEHYSQRSPHDCEQDNQKNQTHDLKKKRKKKKEVSLTEQDKMLST